MKALMDIETFGGIDADADDLLDSCFQDHEAYVEALNHRRPIIIGRKGSGKTAIYRKIQRMQEHDAFVFGHAFSEYPWAHHNLQATIGVPEEQRFVHSWRYLILMTMARILINQDNSQPWNDESRAELDTLKKFIVDSYGTPRPELTQLFTPGKRLKIKPHLKVGNFVSLGVDLESYPVSELPKVFQEVNRSVAETVVKCLNPKNNYYICFDELDRGFDPNDSSYVGMLVGLILAASSMNSVARSAGRKFSVILCLRDDIYQILRFEDKNKLTENALSRIEWDTPRTRWTLKQLMERRFAVVLESETPLSWEEVFDEKQLMTGRQSKYQHILDRGFQRPRDVIKFCNEILRSYKTQSDRTVTRFSNDNIATARASYSEYLIRELDDEIFKHIPNHSNYFELLKTLDALQFSREEFE
jgi:hypothetical protein